MVYYSEIRGTDTHMHNNMVRGSAEVSGKVRLKLAARLGACMSRLCV